MQWFLANSGRVLDLAGQHLVLAVLPMVLGLLLAIPLAQLARQNNVLRSAVVTATSLLYTIPSLALFIILPSILGTRVLDPVNVVVALTIYAVALLVRAALDAFDSVSEDLRQAAVAMGYKPVARFVQIDLPLSLPVLFAGLRVVSVSNISLVSVAALLGIGNLGMLFTSGLQRDFVTEVVVGIVAILVLALLMDGLLVLLERLLTPWTRAGAKTGKGGAVPGASVPGASGTAVGAAPAAVEAAGPAGIAAPRSGSGPA
jgi:osmoprotectant transport system permease protein